MISTIATQQEGEVGWDLSPTSVLSAISSSLSFSPTDHKHTINEMWLFRS